MAGSAGLHLVAAGGLAHASGMHVLLLFGMAFVCLPCAARALLAPTRRSWIRAGVVSAGMLTAHPLMGFLGAAHSGHSAHAGVALPVVVSIGMVAGPAVALCLAVIGTVAQRRVRPAGA